MKELSELKFPENLRYAESHEWLEAPRAHRVRIGITDFAQDQLGDVVYVELPDVGNVVERARPSAWSSPPRRSASSSLPSPAR